MSNHDLTAADTIVFDSSRAPLLFVTAYGSVSDAAFTGVLAALERELGKGRPFVLVFDLTRSASPPAHHRKQIAEWMRRNEEQIASTMAGLALIFVSPVFRFVLSALLVMQPFRFPHVVCATEEEAVRWARARLATL